MQSKKHNSLQEDRMPMQGWLEKVENRSHPKVSFTKYQGFETTGINGIYNGFFYR